MSGRAVLATLLLLAACAAPVSDTRRSGFEFMSPSTQALQRDDSQNPAMLWVQEGAAAWARSEAGAPACTACHGADASALRDAVPRYPRFDATLVRPVTLAERINLCRVRHQQRPALAPESEALLGLEAYVAHAARGEPIAPDDDMRLEPFRARGAALYAQRLGQLDLSCAQCHDGLAGRRLGGSTIPQAHPTGYPAYRLEWQSVGSLQRRLRSCIGGVRAEAPAYGALELVELELYLMRRARGLPLETPAVRP